MNNEKMVALVQSIQATSKELTNLQQGFPIFGSADSRRAINTLLRGLEIQKIFKNVNFDNDELSDADGEYFMSDDKQVMKGFMIYAVIEDSEAKGNETWEEHKEIFLLEDGSLKRFETTYRWYNCPDCGVTHRQIERTEADEVIDELNELMVS